MEVSGLFGFESLPQQMNDLVKECCSQNELSSEEFVKFILESEEFRAYNSRGTFPENFENCTIVTAEATEEEKF